jgi:hypothetical protein
MAKKCKCGREIDDRWEECYLCKKKAENPTDARTASIERQVAAKCAASVLSGRSGPETEIVAVFNVFLRLIRG